MKAFLLFTQAKALLVFLGVLCTVASGHPKPGRSPEAPEMAFELGYRALADTSPVPRGLLSSDDVASGRLSKRQCRPNDLYCPLVNACCNAGSSCCGVNFCCPTGYACPVSGPCYAANVVTVTSTITAVITSITVSTVYSTSISWLTQTSTGYVTVITHLQTGVSTSTVWATITTTRVMKRGAPAAPTPTMTEGHNIQAVAPRPSMGPSLVEGQVPIADLVRRALGNAGLLEKRVITSYVAATITSTYYSYSYYTVRNVVTSTTIRTVLSTVTSTIVDGASTTTTVTSTATTTVTSLNGHTTPTPSPGSVISPPASSSYVSPAASESPTLSGSDSGLSQGAKIGIGVGVSLAAVLVLGLVGFCLWRYCCTGGERRGSMRMSNNDMIMSLPESPASAGALGAAAVIGGEKVRVSPMSSKSATVDVSPISSKSATVDVSPMSSESATVVVSPMSSKSATVVVSPTSSTATTVVKNNNEPGKLIERNNFTPVPARKPIGSSPVPARKPISPSLVPEAEQSHMRHDVDNILPTGSIGSETESSTSPTSKFTEFDQTGARAPIPESLQGLKSQHAVYKEVVLPPNSDFIRVLVLKPNVGSPTDIICELKPLRLCEKYDALSYFWGDQSDTVPIKINGQTFNVTRNLHDALAKLLPDPRAGRDRVLWVDAICINQDDLAERNREVLRMHDIYSSALNVVVWLGKATAESIDALDFFTEVLMRNPNEATLARTYDTDRSKWRSLGQGVLEREWWTRIWVIQEIVLAKHIVIFCGAHCIPWEWLAQLVVFAFEKHFMLVDYESSDNKYDGFRHTAVSFEGARRRYQSSGPFPLTQLIVLHAKHQATKDVDRIYGILGMAADLDFYEFKPDYRLNPAIVFMQTTERIVSKTKKLDIIALGRRRDRLPGLPSWCPDYRTKAGEEPIPFTQLHVPETPGFFAGGITTAHVQFYRNGEMTVAGWHIGHIAKLGAPCEALSRGESYFDAERDVLLECLELATGGPGYPLWNAQYPVGGDLTNYDALSRVLVCDTNANNKRCNDQEGFFRHNKELPADFEPMLSDSARKEAWETKVGIMGIHWRNGRRLAVLDGNIPRTQGLFGLVPAESKKEDIVVILSGCSVPLVLRDKGNKQELIGHWYSEDS